MKTGSIVECTKPHEEQLGLPAVGLEERFTVEAVIGCPCGRCEKRLQFVGVSPKSVVGIPIGYKISHFSELIPPIEDIEEYINQNTVERVKEFEECEELVEVEQ